MSRNCARTANSLLRLARVALLRPMAPPLVLSDAAVGAVPREGTGGEESTTTGGGDAPVDPVVMCSEVCGS